MFSKKQIVARGAHKQERSQDRQHHSRNAKRREAAIKEIENDWRSDWDGFGKGRGGASQ